MDQVNENGSLDFPLCHWELVYEHRLKENPTNLSHNILPLYSQVCSPLNFLLINVGDKEIHISNFVLAIQRINMKPTKRMEVIVIKNQLDSYRITFLPNTRTVVIALCTANSKQ